MRRPLENPLRAVLGVFPASMGLMVAGTAAAAIVNGQTHGAGPLVGLIVGLAAISAGWLVVIARHRNVAVSVLGSLATAVFAWTLAVTATPDLRPEDPYFYILVAAFFAAGALGGIAFPGDFSD